MIYMCLVSIDESTSPRKPVLVHTNIHSTPSRTQIMVKAKLLVRTERLVKHPEISCIESTQAQTVPITEQYSEPIDACMIGKESAVIILAPRPWEFFQLIHIQARRCHGCEKFVIAGKICGSCKTQNRRPAK